MWDSLFCYVPEAKSYVNPLKLLLCAEISCIKLAKNSPKLAISCTQGKKKRRERVRGVLEGGGTLLIFCGNLSELFFKHPDLINEMSPNHYKVLLRAWSWFLSCALQPPSSSFKRVDASVTWRTTLQGEWMISTTRVSDSDCLAQVILFKIS